MRVDSVLSNNRIAQHNKVKLKTEKVGLYYGARQAVASRLSYASLIE
jgi:hypothetical protein